MYRVWYYSSTDNVVHQASLASVALYDTWCWYDTILSRYFFKAGDGSETNVLIVPKRPVSIDTVEDEATAFADFLAQILGPQKADSFRNNLTRSTMTLAELARFTFVMPDDWEPELQQDSTANLSVPVLTSKMPLTRDDLTTIAAAAKRFIMTIVRMPTFDFYPVSSSPATIIVIPKVDINKGSYFDEFKYELKMFLEELYTTGCVEKAISFTDGKFVDKDTIEDVLLSVNLITNGTVRLAQSSSQSSGGSSGGASSSESGSGGSSGSSGSGSG